VDHHGGSVDRYLRSCNISYFEKISTFLGRGI
jgi:hypothetical protein